MRIAFIVKDFPCLSETFILNEVVGLIKRGHDVDIYAEKLVHNAKIHPEVRKYSLLDRTQYPIQLPGNYLLRLLKGVQLVAANFYKNPRAIIRALNFKKYGRQALSLRLLYEIVPWLNRPSYDIIQCHFGFNGLKGLALRELGLFQGKLVTTFHGIDISKHIQTKGEHIYAELFEKGDLFLPVSHYWKHKLIKLGCDEKKIIVHWMGVNCSHFSFTPCQPHPDGQVKLISINRLVEKKGLEYSIYAVAEIAKTGQNIEYNIIGDGPLRDDLQRLIQYLNICHCVKLLGWKQKLEIIELLKQSHILLAPSVTSKNGDQEGLPLALKEAMAVGLPVISTLHCGISELVEDGISGFLVPERDVDALVTKLNYLIEHPEIWLSMGKEGRRQVQENFDLDKLNEQLIKIYQELITS